MRYILKLLFVLLLTTTVANATDCGGRDGKVVDVTKEHSNVDFSKLLKVRGFLGYIGENYQRLFIGIHLVEKDKSKIDTYHVEGYRMIKNQSGWVKFSGEILVTKICQFSDKELKKYNLIKDPDGNDFYNNLKAKGRLMAHYKFNEDQSKQNYMGLEGLGEFKGNMWVDWVVTRNSKLVYDFIDAGRDDNYSNNQYEGTWVDSESGVKKVANWGNFRIPNSRKSSGGLDCGEGEFGVCKEYKQNGWEYDLEYKSYDAIYDGNVEVDVSKSWRNPKNTKNSNKLH